MLIIVCCLLLLFFWVKVSRVNPAKYPHVLPSQVAAWQNMLWTYRRRYTGLLLIWIVLAISNGAILNQALQHDGGIWNTIYYTTLILTSAYLIASLVYIIASSIKMRRWAREQKILPRPKGV